MLRLSPMLCLLTVLCALFLCFSFCAPSRNSFMTGRGIDTTKDWNFDAVDDFRNTTWGKDWTSWPEHFKNSGWLVGGAGKTFHPGIPADYDYPRSWSPDFPYQAPLTNGIHTCIQDGMSFCGGHQSTFCSANTTKDEPRPEYQLQDQQVLTSGLNLLRNMSEASKTSGNPFAAWVGFHKPHGEAVSIACWVSSVWCVCLTTPTVCSLIDSLSALDYAGGVLQRHACRFPADSQPLGPYGHA